MKTFLESPPSTRLPELLGELRSQLPVHADLPQHFFQGNALSAHCTRSEHPKHDGIGRAEHEVRVAGQQICQRFRLACVELFQVCRVELLLEPFQVRWQNIYHLNLPAVLAEFEVNSVSLALSVLVRLRRSDACTVSIEPGPRIQNITQLKGLRTWPYSCQRLQLAR